MSGDSNSVLNYAPFPPLEWNEYSWIGEIVLRFWRGFQARRGPYGSLSSRESSDGTATLNVVPPENEERRAPIPEQAEAYRYLLANEQAVCSAVLSAIYDTYPGLCDLYGYDEEVAEDLMPVIKRPDQLMPLIGLANVHFLTVAKDNIAYIGFEFGCTWDSEHGLGVMTHKDRVVEVGNADTSFDGWIAKGDAETGEKNN